MLMKMNVSKKTVISLFFIFLMVGSTVTYSLLQSIRQPENKEVKLPTTNVVDYELTEEQEKLLIEDGKVVLKFLYSKACEGCLQKKNVLDSVAADNAFSSQVMIEEILSSRPDLPMLTVVSYRGQKILTNYTNDDLLDALCELMVQPPVSCAVRKI